MSTSTEIACSGPQGSLPFRIESLPFSEIPGQSKLFLEYQSDPLSLRRFYPNAVASHTGIADRIPKVLDKYAPDRDILCDALDDQNRTFGAGEKTFANISILREQDAVAVVTGQQAGLFTGPLYTIFKALSAVRMAECLRGRGFKAVPVFWAATEDHDFDEVSHAYLIGRNGEIEGLNSAPQRLSGVPVGEVILDQTISDTIDELYRSLSEGENTPTLRTFIDDNWRPGVGFGTAFCSSIARLFGRFGMVVLDPMHPTLKRLAAPIYVEAIRNRDEIVAALTTRSRELEAAGYHAQIDIGDDYFPLFWHAEDGTRNSLRKSGANTYRAKGIRREFTLDELAEIAASNPERFSPNVVLRAAVQDFILPTACYFGGAAEIAYFAQSGEVYRVLGRPVTPILHRQSFTVIEPKQAKTLERYDLAITDLFAGLDAVSTEIVEKHLNKETAVLFADVEAKINIELRRLDEALSDIDPTLAANLATRRRKIIYHIGALRTKFHRSQLRRDETTERRIRSLFAALMPNGALQERSLNITYFLDRYGPEFLDWMYRATDLDDKGHRLIYLS